MNSITVSAKTVSDAITEASIQLGVVSTSMEYEVITEGSTGFLGIGRKQAVIKAWKKEEKIEKPVKPEVKKEAKQNKKEVKKEVKKEIKEIKKETKPAKPAKPEKVEKAEKIEKVEKVVVAEEKEDKEEKLCEVQPNTIAACETFLKDVLKTMGMKLLLVSMKMVL